MKKMANKITPGSNALTRKARYFFMGVVFLTFTSVCFAQDGSDPGSSSISSPDETNTPFDGGVTVLVAAGIAYGAKKAYDAKRKEAAASVKAGVTG